MISRKKLQNFSKEQDYQNVWLNLSMDKANSFSAKATLREACFGFCCSLFFTVYLISMASILSHSLFTNLLLP